MTIAAMIVGKRFQRYVILSVLAATVSACVELDAEYVPLVSVNFADHNAHFRLVGSDRADDLKFTGNEYEVRHDEVLDVFVVTGKGTLHFLELVIEFDLDSIRLNGRPVEFDLVNGDSRNRVVYQDGTVVTGFVSLHQ